MGDPDHSLTHLIVADAIPFVEANAVAASGVVHARPAEDYRLIYSGPKTTAIDRSNQSNSNDIQIVSPLSIPPLSRWPMIRGFISEGGEMEHIVPLPSLGG